MLAGVILTAPSLTTSSHPHPYTPHILIHSHAQLLLALQNNSLELHLLTPSTHPVTSSLHSAVTAPGHRSDIRYTLLLPSCPGGGGRRVASSPGSPPSLPPLLMLAIIVPMCPSGLCASVQMTRTSLLVLPNSSRSGTGAPIPLLSLLPPLTSFTHSLPLLTSLTRSSQQCIHTMQSGYALSSSFAPGDRHLLVGTKVLHTHPYSSPP